MFFHSVCCDIYDLSVQVSMAESLAARSVLSSRIRSSGTRILPWRLGWEFAKILIAHLAYILSDTKEYHLTVVNISLVWWMFTHLSHASENLLAQTIHLRCSTRAWLRRALQDLFTTMMIVQYIVKVIVMCSM